MILRVDTVAQMPDEQFGLTENAAVFTWQKRSELQLQRLKKPQRYVIAGARYDHRVTVGHRIKFLLLLNRLQEGAKH